MVFINNEILWLTIPLTFGPEAPAGQAVSGAIKEYAHE
jgi:hypothetical protein